MLIFLLFIQLNSNLDVFDNKYMKWIRSEVELE